MPPCITPTAAVVHGTSKPAYQGPSARQRSAMSATCATTRAAASMAFTALGRLRRMRGMALDAAAPAVHALVRQRRHHAGGLADDAVRGRQAGVLEVGDQVAHAETSPLPRRS
jgi:hypothetical protein